MNRMVAVGKVTSPHGLRGWVKVLPLTDNSKRFDLLKSVYLSGGREDSGRSANVEGVKYQAERVLLKFEGIDTREEADGIRNLVLQIPESEVDPIEEEDTYYFYQLEGMKVRDAEGETLGTLESVVRTGSNDVYVILAEDGKTEYMAPALKKCILEVDLEKSVMIVNREWVT